jgi:hypothetical protein
MCPYAFCRFRLGVNIQVHGTPLEARNTMALLLPWAKASGFFTVLRKPAWRGSVIRCSARLHLFGTVVAEGVHNLLGNAPP